MVRPGTKRRDREILAAIREGEAPIQQLLSGLGCYPLLDPVDVLWEKNLNTESLQCEGESLDETIMRRMLEGLDFGGPNGTDCPVFVEASTGEQTCPQVLFDGKSGRILAIRRHGDELAVVAEVDGIRHVVESGGFGRFAAIATTVADG